MRNRSIGIAIVTVLLGFFVRAPHADAQQTTTLYNFTGGSDGKWPCSGVVADPSGALYGETQDGKVFRLTPPASPGDGWGFSVIYATPAGFAYRCLPLTLDSSGTIYGIQQATPTSRPIVFKLSPPPGGGIPWQMTVIRRLNATTGGIPASLVWSEQAGALFGTTMQGGAPDCWAESLPGGDVRIGCGTVFKLTPPSSGAVWQEQILHRFHGTPTSAPLGPIAIRSDGTVFGLTMQGPPDKSWGALYTLMPPASGVGRWQFAIVHNFPFGGNRIYDPNGLLFGPGEGTLYMTALGGGPARRSGSLGGSFGMFSAPSAGAKRWKLSSEHYFGLKGDLIQPNGYLALDSDGAVYGSVYSEGGGIFKMIPPEGSETEWQYSVLAAGSWAAGSIVVAADKTIYAAGEFGGTPAGCNSVDFTCGRIFKVTQ